MIGTRPGELWDFVVVGAGIAGASAAAWCAMHDPSARVLLLERSTWPRSKVCGSCLNPGGVRILEELGVLGDAGMSDPQSLRAHAVSMRRVTVHRGARCVTLAHPGGLVIERSILDAALVRHAQNAGVRFEAGCSTRIGDRRDSAWTVHIQRGASTLDVRARILFIADGLSGTSLSHLPIFAPRVSRASRIGLGALIPPWRPEPETTRMIVGSHGYFGAVELRDGRTCLGAAVDPDWVRSVGGPAEAIARIARSCALEPPEFGDVRFRGTPELTRARARVAAPGLFVMGDAAGYVEPFTGEGMTWALHSARAGAGIGAEALRSGEAGMEEAARAWERFHAHRLAPRQAWCRAVRLVTHRPSITAAAVGALERVGVVRAGVERMLAQSGARMEVVR